jgi:putative copper resistance protein D
MAQVAPRAAWAIFVHWPARRVLAALAVVAVVVLAPLIALAGPAWAHASLKSSTPGNGASLAEPPGEVVLRFTEPINPASVAVAVRGADGAAAVDGGPRVAREVVTQPLRRAIGPGQYAVTFQVVSADGHRINGTLHFAVTSAGAAPAPAGSSAPVDHGSRQQEPGNAPPPTAHSEPPAGPPAGALVTAAGTAFGAVVLLWWWLRPAEVTGRRQRYGSHRLLGPVPETGPSLAAAGVLAAAAAVVAGLAFGGGAHRAALPGLPDPGVATAWLLPAARLATIVAAVTTVGLLLAAVLLSPVREPVLTHRRAAAPVRRGLSDSGQGWLRAAAWSAGLWCATAVVALWLSCVDITGRSLSVSQLADFATRPGIGLALTVVALLAGVLVVACHLVRGPAGVLAVLALALLTAIPPVFTGHTAAGRYPQVATSGLVLHVLAATTWAGGLLALALSMRAPVGQLAVAVRRFSPLAATCFAVVGSSGLLSAWLHLPSLDALTGSSYGGLVMAKAAVLAVIGAVGWWHQRRSMPALRAGSGRCFARLAAVEVLLFGAVVGLAMALSRTAPPAAGTGSAAAGHAGHAMASGDHPLLGYPMPPRPSAGSLLTWWLPEPLFLLAAAGAAGLYLGGVWRLRCRSARWPIRRTAAWVGGCAVVVAATSTGVARYAPTLPSVHLVRHLLLAVVAPLLLALAAPTLLARAVLPASTDIHWPGPREWLAAGVHTRVARLLDRPAVVLVAFAAGLPVVYFTRVYEAALRSPAVHLLVLSWSLVVGMLFFRVLTGAGSRPLDTPRWLTFAGASVFAVVGVVFLASGITPAADWFTELGRPWYIPGERYRAGAVVLILGALPVLLASLARRPRTAHPTGRPAPPVPVPPAPRLPADGVRRGHAHAPGAAARPLSAAHR